MWPAMPYYSTLYHSTLIFEELDVKANLIMGFFLFLIDLH